MQRVKPGGDLRRAGPARQLAVAVSRDHGRRPREEVAELVRQLPLIAFVERVLGGRTVAPERRRTNGPVAHRIAPVHVHERERVDDVPERLRDLRALHGQVAVHEKLLRYVVSRRHEHCWPVHAVEAKDVLAEHVASCRPVRRHEVLTRTGVRERAQVVDERVSPDVGDLALVPRQRDAPGLARAADREVLQATRDEAPRLVVAERRQHEVGPLVVEREQPLLIRGEPEEVVLLLDVLDTVSVLGALAVDELVLRLELLAADAVQAGVHVLVDVAVVVDPLDEVTHELLVAVVRRSDEEVGLRADGWRQLAPDLADAVDVVLTSSPCSSAARYTFVACSSVPVRKNESWPSWR